MFRFIPSNLHSGIKAGTDTTDLSTYLQAALDSGASYLFLPIGRFTGGAGVSITSGITVEFGVGAKLYFPDDTSAYLKVTGTSGVHLIRPYLDGGTSTVRGTNAMIHVKTSSDILISGAKCIAGAGTGILIGDSCSDVSIEAPFVKNTLADGIHITGASSRVSVSSPRVYGSGDDGIAIVGYSTNPARVSDVAVSDALVVNSGSRGIAVLGGERVRVSGSVENSVKQGLLIAEDTTYGTFSSRRVTFDVSVYDSQDKGAEIGRAATDVTGHALVYNASGRGVDIGNITSRASRIKVSAQVHSCNSIGVHATGVDRLSLPEIVATENAAQGVALLDVTDLMVGTILAHNNNTAGTAGTDNVQFNGPTNFTVGSVVSIDDRGTALVERALEVINSSSGVIGQVLGSGGTAGTLILDGTSNSNVRWAGGEPFSRGFIGTVTAKPTTSHEPVGAWCWDSSAFKIYVHAGSGTWKESVAMT